MKKQYFKKAKKFSRKTAIDQTVDANKTDADKNVLYFSLTQKETKRCEEWLEYLWSKTEMDDGEDSYVLYPEFHFTPFELGVCIEVSVGKNRLLIRTAWEDDEVKKGFL